VLTLAIFAALAAAMANTIAKHKHYPCKQMPSSGIARRVRWNANFTAESTAQPKTHPLTLAELLQHADEDGVDGMVYRLHYTSRCSIVQNIRPLLQGSIHVRVHHKLLQNVSLSCIFSKLGLGKKAYGCGRPVRRGMRRHPTTRAVGVALHLIPTCLLF